MVSSVLTRRTRVAAPPPGAAWLFYRQAAADAQLLGKHTRAISGQIIMALRHNALRQGSLEQLDEQVDLTPS